MTALHTTEGGQAERKIMSKVHKVTMLAWISGEMLQYYGADLQGGDPVAAVQACSFYLTPDDTTERRKCWERSHICLGRADITLVLDDEAKIVDAQITTLRAKKASVLAEAQNEATQIERQIQTLLAITNEVKP